MCKRLLRKMACIKAHEEKRLVRTLKALYKSKQIEEPGIKQLTLFPL